MTDDRLLIVLAIAVLCTAVCLVAADQLDQNWIAFVGVGLLGIALVVRELMLWGSPKNVALSLGAILLFIGVAFLGQRLIA